MKQAQNNNDALDMFIATAVSFVLWIEILSRILESLSFDTARETMSLR